MEMILLEQLDKILERRVKLFPNFTRHHLITDTNMDILICGVYPIPLVPQGMSRTTRQDSMRNWTASLAASYLTVPSFFFLPKEEALKLGFDLN